jgi:hypothetical protein
MTSDLSGTLSLQSNGVAVTVPAVAGTMMVSGNMPAFSAYRSGAQTGLSSSAYSKVNLNAENFDTASAFDSTTNYRFTPLVAGYYQINAVIDGTGTNLQYLIASLYKNGSGLANGSFSSATTGEYSSSVSSLIYLNGSTDYVELYCFLIVSAGTGTVNGVSLWQTFMNGSLVRGA